MVAGDHELVHEVAQKLCGKARGAQTAVATSLTAPPTEKHAQTIFTIYAGLSAFEETLDFARGIRGQIPTATIVILTCDCDLHTKGQTLRHALETSDVNHVVVTHACGGVGVMGYFVDQFLKAA